MMPRTLKCSGQRIFLVSLLIILWKMWILMYNKRMLDSSVIVIFMYIPFMYIPCLFFLFYTKSSQSIVSGSWNKHCWSPSPNWSRSHLRLEKIQGGRWSCASILRLGHNDLNTGSVRIVSILRSDLFTVN